MSEENKEETVKLGSVIVRKGPENNRRALCKVRTKELFSIHPTKRGTLTFSAVFAGTELTADEATKLAHLLLESADETRQNATEEGTER